MNGNKTTKIFLFLAEQSKAYLFLLLTI